MDTRSRMRKTIDNFQSKKDYLTKMSKKETDLYKLGVNNGMIESFDYCIAELEDKFMPKPMTKKDYVWTYILIVIGILVIIFLYFIMPLIF
jgi:hypothetical protein